MIVLCALLLAGSAAATPPATPPATPRSRPVAALVCQKKPGDSPEEEQSTRESAEKSPLFLLAKETLGAPTACKNTWIDYEGQKLRSISFTFKGGSFLSEVSPPETIVVELLLDRGSLDETKARAVLAAMAKESNGNIDWKAAPEKSVAKDGTTTETWFDPEPGVNLGLDLVRRKGAVVGARMHIAL